jgi:hypothetical protein
MPLRDKITEIYIDFDDYLKEKFPNANRKHSFTNLSKLSLSEMASIEIGYHQSVYKCFKYYYQEEILVNLKSYFPNAVSYERFVALKYRVKPYLESFLRDTRLALPTDANFIDNVNNGYYLRKVQLCYNL